MRRHASEVVVFLGPTLPADEARNTLDARYLPPIRQGDLYRVVAKDSPRIVAIIDGYFHFVPSVWHREILWALARGVHVLGAASMGALRAAELGSFGMQGVGKIFEAYRSGKFAPYDDASFEADDEVAVLHGPAEVGYVALSDALVDMRATLAAAAELDVISKDTRDRLVNIARETYYQKRSYDLLLDQADALSVRPNEIVQFRRWLPGNQVALKKRDALELLDRLAHMSAEVAEPFKAEFHFERASVWESFRATLDLRADRELSRVEQIALAEARLDPLAWRSARRQAARREAALRHADSYKERLTADDTRAELSALRKSAGLLRRRELESWMEKQALDASGLARLMEEEALLRKLEQDVSTSAIVDQLRLEGMFDRLVARGLEKEQSLAAISDAARSPTAVEAAAALAWFFEQYVSLDDTFDVPVLAAEFGYPDEASFVAALWRERIYQSAQIRSKLSDSKPHVAPC